jgi:hypothetical protein
MTNLTMIVAVVKSVNYPSHADAGVSLKPNFPQDTEEDVEADDPAQLDRENRIYC